MVGRPQASEAASYYFNYIDLVATDDIMGELEWQLAEMVPFLEGISEEQSLHSYAPDKWTIRQVLNHVNDGERTFLFRAYWFARGMEGELPSMDQDICAAAAKGNDFSWATHVEDFRQSRLATLAFLRTLPPEAWDRSGVASEKPVTVKALIYILAGHVTHHRKVLEERYL
jgi:hypothetical protein